MFVESLVESSPLLRSRNRAPALIAIAAQCALVITLIAIPVLHPEVLSAGPLKLSVLEPPPMPAPKPLPVLRPHVQPAVATSAPSTPATASPIINLIQGILHTTDPAVGEPLPIGSATMSPNNPAFPVSPVGNTPNVIVKPAASPGRIRISAGVTAGLLLAPIQPVYPTIAKASGTQGTVVIAATISKTGHIESAHVVSGPAMLQGAALDAVRAARYHPFLLNGEPIEVETTININFKMN